MKVLTEHEPFLIEFTQKELSRIEEVLSDARALEYRRAKELLSTSQLGGWLDPKGFVADLDAVLFELDQLELWAEDDDWEDDWDDDDDSMGPGLPCHLMPRSSPGQS